MGNVTTISAALPDYSPPQLQLIQRTVANGTTPDEFSMFIEICRRTKLDPFRKQIYCIIYNADKPDKRRVVFVVGIEGMRAIANRHGDYRPDDEPPRYEFSETAKSDTNPAGIISCTVFAYKQDRSGVWHKVAGTMYWDEFAPTIPVFKTGEDGRWMKGPGGDFVVDRWKLPATSMWAKMSRHMASIAAERICLRRGWPEDCAALYGEEEVERDLMREKAVLELTPAESVAEFERDQRQARLGGPTFTFDFAGDQPLRAVPRGQAADAVIKAVSDMKDAADIERFEIRNRDTLRELWGFDKDAAFAVKEQIERRKEEIQRDSKGQTESASAS